MIVTNKNDFVIGNNVLQPEEQTSRQFEKKDNKNLNDKLIKKHEKLKLKFKILMSVVLGFVLGIVIIYRYSVLYQTQKNLNDIKNEVAIKQKENERLRLELLKFQNQEYIEEEALGKLQMTKPDKNLIEYIDLGKNNFKNKKDIISKKDSNSILEKIKRIFS